MVKTETHLYFWSGDIYSNWYEKTNLIIDPTNGVKFRSSEQFFMFQKAKFFGSEDSMYKIANCYSPGDAKKLGRLVANFDENSWTTVRLGLMTYTVYQKFNQNIDLAQQLLETGDLILVEASPFDKIWGVGLDENDERILDKNNWKGLNLLGIALMQTRKLIRNNKNN